MNSVLSESLPPAVRSDLEHRLHESLGFQLERVVELDAPVIHNNRLYRLHSREGRDLLLKLYQQDGRQRLEREFAALTFLTARGFATVPTPYLLDEGHYYAVYSFEPGANRPSAHWTTDDARAAGAFAAELHQFTRDTPSADFPTAFSGTFSYADMLAGLRRRLAIFSRYVASAESLPPPIQSFLSDLDPVAEVERLIAAALRGLSHADIAARVPHEHHRLSTNDFAPHNILIRPAGHAGSRLCVLDHEYFGWDEPAALVAGFLTAEQALDLPPAARQAFLESYRTSGVAPPVTFDRLERVGLLMHLSWCGVHLQLCAPEFIAKKRFASPNLDVTTHLQDQLSKLHRRLAVAQATLGPPA